MKLHKSKMTSSLLLVREHLELSVEIVQAQGVCNAFKTEFDAFDRACVRGPLLDKFS
jgi:hypothetical protein